MIELFIIRIYSCDLRLHKRHCFATSSQRITDLQVMIFHKYRRQSR